MPILCSYRKPTLQQRDFDNYNVYTTNHTSGSGHGGSAVIIKKCIQIVKLQSFQQECMQATNIQIKDSNGPISSIYCPPKHNISFEQYCDFMKSLGNRFIIDGDFNAKHVQCGSRLTNIKGKKLLSAIIKNKCVYFSTREPTYWPSDLSKNPDLIDFCIAKNIKLDQVSSTSEQDVLRY